MRVTNGMLVNTTLSGLYKSTNSLNKTYLQMTTGKKIQTVSDDPIIAGRTLKLTTNVKETEQYISNIKAADSWLKVTDGALSNMTSIMRQIREKVNQAANSHLQASDKKAIQTEVEELWKQMFEEANVSYDGRYVFSGYKTGEPLVLTSDMTLEEDYTTNSDFAIREGSDIKADSVLKQGSQLGTGSVLGTGTQLSAGFVIPKGTTLSKADAEALLGIRVSSTGYTLTDQQTVPAGTTLSKDVAMSLDPSLNITGDTYIVPDGGMNIAAGTTLTPAAAKETLGITPSDTTYTLTNDHTLAAGRTLAGDMTIGPNAATLNADVTLKGNSKMTGGTVLTEGSVIKSGSTLTAGTVNPKVNGKISDQNIEYQIGVNSTITVNTLGMDEIFNDISKCFGKLYNDITATLNGNMTDLELSKNYSASLNDIDDIMHKLSVKTSELGSKEARANYVQSRLADQKTTFKDLLTETEGVDIEEVYTNFNIQYATYQSALQASAKIITNTLANYL